MSKQPPEPKKPIRYPEVPCDGALEFTLRPQEEKTTWAQIQAIREDAWRSRVLAYEEDPEDFWVAWHWLNQHPLFYRFTKGLHERYILDDRGILDGCVEVVPAKVNPETNRVSEDLTKNTKLEFWVEVFTAGSWGADCTTVHDFECDTGGDTYELAIVAVAKEIYKRHGNDRTALDKELKQ